MNKVYILRKDNYYTWAYENGATNILAVSNNIDKILKAFQSSYVRETLISKDRIIGGKDTTCYDETQKAKKVLEMGFTYYCDIFINNDNYEDETNYGTFVIEVKEMI